MISAAQNVLDRYDLLVIDFKYQKSIISRLFLSSTFYAAGINDNHLTSENGK